MKPALVIFGASNSFIGCEDVWIYVSRSLHIVLIYVVKTNRIPAGWLIIAITEINSDNGNIAAGRGQISCISYALA